MAISSDEQHKAVIDRDTWSLHMTDIEVAIDLCNDISLIINEHMDRLQGSALSEASDLLALHDLQRHFAHTLRSNLTRDNLSQVHDFIATYTTPVKRYFELGEVPAFIQEPGIQGA
jgi:hypothetical protein